MTTTDFQAELSAAGAHVSTRWDRVRFFIRRYPLGAAGAVIMFLFLFAVLMWMVKRRIWANVEH